MQPMLTPDRCALILLAAGQSRRFAGGAKLLHPFRGGRLIDCALDLGARLDFATRILVARPGLTIESRDYVRVDNDRPEAGMAHSLRLGVAALDGADVDGCLVMLADMPFVTLTHVEELFAASAGGLVASEAQGVRQPPALFAAAHFAALASSTGDHGPRELLRQAAPVAAAPAMLADIDTRADLARFS